MILGSSSIMLFFENSTQTVEMINIETNGNIGRIASINGRILPVRFLYDLDKSDNQKYILSIELTLKDSEVCSVNIYIIMR